MKRNKNYMSPCCNLPDVRIFVAKELPTDLPDQPFVYLGDSKELPKPTKSAILGEIELIMHVYVCFI